MEQHLSFSLHETLSILGVVQCIYIVVHMLLEKGVRVGMPVLYFAVLGCAFFFDILSGVVGINGEIYLLVSMLVWLSLVPLSVLLILKLSDMEKPIKLVEYWPLALFVVSVLTLVLTGVRNSQWFALISFMIGGVSLASIWGRQHLFKRLRSGLNGKQRYWLSLSIVFVSTVLLGDALASISGLIDDVEFSLLRTILGLAFVYLAMTSVLRIYPKVQKKNINTKELSNEDKAVINSIVNLLEYEKVYHEPSYSRGDMARELEVSEARLSKIITAHFKKSLPSVLNARRVDDAKRLLIQSDATIQVIASEVGFNSLASFNRAFKKLEGVAPSAFRSKGKLN